MQATPAYCGEVSGKLSSSSAAMAREFDQLSAEDGRTWPATDFVRWLRDEYRASAEANATAGERREAA